MRRLLYFVLLFFPVLGFSQDYYYPIAVELSHPELVIKRISFNEKNTVVDLSVTNNILGGWFCADKNIYILNKVNNKRYNLRGSKNIPNCPDKYEFRIIGEKLEFTLYFESIPNHGERIDLVEDCNNSCFYFKDILLNNDKNRDIHLFETSVIQYESGNIDQAENNFKKIISTIPDNPTHVYGFAYSYLYKIALKKGDKAKAEEWKSEFMKSNLPNKDYYLKNFTAD